MGMAWHAASTGKTRNGQRILVANVKGKDQLEVLVIWFL